ncbi:thymidine kinase [Citricoccus sp. SGAir0253]|uniref:thymidine kinase n=1 Tax=Citricoccus sp. SGAir0253 TaxID=2567881 RepID=UPI001FEE8E6B
MFAGKSEELMRRVRRAWLAGLSVEVVNHALDLRHGSADIASHAGLSIPARSVADAAGLAALVADQELDLLAVDEAQFFGPELVPVVTRLAGEGLTVVVSGLCVTFDGLPFEPLPALMAVAEDVVKLTAVCSTCGEDAAFHVRLPAGDGGRRGAGAGGAGPGDSRVAAAHHVGGAETYQARCRAHARPAAAGSADR